MSEADPGAEAPLSELETLTSDLAATRSFVIHAQMALFFALVERKSIDPERFLAFGRLIQAGFRQNAATTTGGRIAARAHAMVADMLAELEATIQNMMARPPGAGTA